VLPKFAGSRVSDAELFTRLLYVSTVPLRCTGEAVWLMPISLLLDLNECHKQFLGWAKPYLEYGKAPLEYGIDEVLPAGLP